MSGKKYDIFLIIKSSLISLLTAVLVTVTLALIFSGILSFTQAPENYIGNSAIITLYLSAIIGSIVNSKQKSTTILSPVLSGILHILAVVSLSLAYTDSNNTYTMPIKFIIFISIFAVYILTYWLFAKKAQKKKPRKRRK